MTPNREQHAAAGTRRVWLTRAPIDTGAIVAALHRDDAGALCTFEGTVRIEARDDGAGLAALDYSAYDEMATEQMHDLRRRAMRQFDILDAALVHRLGRMSPGETSVAIVVSAAHRAAAFEACRWLIDNIKIDVPIWKKDVWDDGRASWTPPETEPSGGT